MNNFDPTNQSSVADFIVKNLARHELMALATTNTDGSPWVVCVNLSYDKELNLYWKSAVASEHSKHLVKNPSASICIFSHDQVIGDFGFYCNAIVHVVSDEAELQHAIDVKYKQKNLPIPPIADFLGDSTRRMYCAVITEAWINDDRHIKASVDLKVLKEHTSKTA